MTKQMRIQLRNPCVKSHTCQHHGRLTGCGAGTSRQESPKWQGHSRRLTRRLSHVIVREATPFSNTPFTALGSHTTLLSQSPVWGTTGAWPATELPPSWIWKHHLPTEQISSLSDGNVIIAVRPNVLLYFLSNYPPASTCFLREEA